MLDNLSFDRNPTDIEIRHIKNELKNYNTKMTEDINSNPINALLIDNNEVIGGLSGTTYWRWLHIDKLWIHKNHRNEGLGSELLKFVENEVYDNDCRNIHLFTHLKAINFYLKNGYKIKYKFDISSNGMKRYLMIKEIKKKQKAEFGKQYGINLDPDISEIQLMSDLLDEYTSEVYGKKQKKNVNLTVRYGKTEIIGGLLAGIVNDWSYIEKIWIKDEYRCNGIGTNLIGIFESESKNNHCKFSQLFAYTFQDMRFFKRIGYETKCKLKDLPRGYSKCLMIKYL
jgi:ribosomal protein S18 acetylase RimI-like enzyme